jgi:indolepyruvate ferredoxin oxidoreductase beta subunit
MSDPVYNIVIAGLGGQGVLKASDILAEAALRAGHDVKKSEVHGMSQRGGSVCSDVRFGTRILSPMVPPGRADFLVVLAGDQVDNNRWQLKPGGILIEPRMIKVEALPHRKSLNIALLGCLSQYLPIAGECWKAALKGNLPEPVLSQNEQAFAMGQAVAGDSAE